MTITAGTYYMSTFVTQLATDLIAGQPVTGGTWTVTLSTGASGTGKVTIAVTNGTYSITWTSTNTRDVLGFTATITAQTTSTGTNQARGLWLPDAPLDLEGHPSMAPKVSDLRLSEGPTGLVIGLVGNVKRRHRGLRWSHVPLARYREASATVVNGTWEKFLDDTQHGQGHSWFAPASLVQIYDLLGTKLGVDLNSTLGWYLKGVEGVDSKRSQQGFTGFFAVEIPEIVSEG